MPSSGRSGISEQDAFYIIPFECCPSGSWDLHYPPRSCVLCTQLVRISFMSSESIPSSDQLTVSQDPRHQSGTAQDLATLVEQADLVMVECVCLPVCVSILAPTHTTLAGRQPCWPQPTVSITKQDGCTAALVSKYQSPSEQERKHNPSGGEPSQLFVL